MSPLFAVFVAMLVLQCSSAQETGLTEEEERQQAVSLKACEAQCDAKVGKCTALEPGLYQCVPLAFIQYHDCMEKCVPKSMEPRIEACTTQCQARRNGEACMKKCLPKDVDAKVTECGTKCEPKGPILPKEELEALEEEERQIAAHGTCMEKCVPADMAKKYHSCETKCRPGDDACMKKCMPADVSKKVEDCHLECHAQATAKPKAEETEARVEQEQPVVT